MEIRESAAPFGAFEVIQIGNQRAEHDSGPVGKGFGVLLDHIHLAWHPRGPERTRTLHEPSVRNHPLPIQGAVSDSNRFQRCASICLVSYGTFATDYVAAR